MREKGNCIEQFILLPDTVAFFINPSYRGKCLDFLRIDDILILNIMGVVYSILS